MCRFVYNCVCAIFSKQLWSFIVSNQICKQVTDEVVHDYQSFQLFRSLMGEGGETESFSPESLHIKILYLWPEGRNVNSSCWGWVGSLRVEAALLPAFMALQRGQFKIITGAALRSIATSITQGIFLEMRFGKDCSDDWKQSLYFILPLDLTKEHCLCSMRSCNKSDCRTPGVLIKMFFCFFFKKTKLNRMFWLFSLLLCLISHCLFTLTVVIWPFTHNWSKYT